jgi:uncharacterized membrane protein YphA (DoxX/SURF4 family)
MNAMTENAAEVLLLLFLAITFLQSGIDKVIDWKGNLGWLKDHFSQSSLAAVVPAMFFVITITELAAGILSILGLLQLVTGGGNNLAFWGAVVSCLALIMLLFGQRVAKDYEGAKTIAIYFVPAVFLVFLLQ